MEGLWPIVIARECIGQNQPLCKISEENEKFLIAYGQFTYQIARIRPPMGSAKRPLDLKIAKSMMETTILMIQQL